MDDVAAPSAGPAAGLGDGVPEVTVELADSAQEKPPAMGELGDGMEVMPPPVTETSLGKEDSPAVPSSPEVQEIVSGMHAGIEKGMEGETDNLIDDNPGDGEVNASSLELDVASGADDCEALVESRVNLSRIPNSPESTH